MKKTLILLFAISSFILPIYSEENVLQNTEITDTQNSLENEEQNITETVPKIEKQNIIKNEENITQTNSDNAKIESLEDLANFSELSDTENQKTEDPTPIYKNLPYAGMDHPEVERFRKQYLSPKWLGLLYNCLENAMEYRLFVRQAIAEKGMP